VAEPGVIVAVKVTFWPCGDGFAEDVNTMDVLFLTTCVTAGDEVLPASLVLPP